MATILPSASAATRSQTVFRLARSWVTMNTVSPSVFCSVLIRASKSPAAIGSSPEVGSSRNTIAGSSASARASATRLVMPPDSSDGNLSPSSGSKPDHFELGGGDLVHQRSRQHEVLAQRKLDVLPHGERRKQRALLEQDAPSAGGALVARSSLLPIGDAHHLDLAALPRNQADDGSHQHRLAAAGSADQPEDLAPSDVRAR